MFTYNATESDRWKNFHTDKPALWNDLGSLHHRLGFWIRITDPEGTTLVVSANELTASQSISLNEGWNLVGYPSRSNKNRTEALNNIVFGTDVAVIESYNATTGSWLQLSENDFFEVGKGYWIYSKVEKTWNVPL